MKVTFRSKLAVSSILAAFAPSVATHAIAQDSSATTGTGAGSGTVQPAPPTKAEQKAAKKAARKQARAKKNAELKKLEDAGYNPGRGEDPNYPQDVQNAQKKVGAGQGASASQ